MAASSQSKTAITLEEEEEEDVEDVEEGFSLENNMF